MTVAINTKKKQDLTEMANVGQDKENANKFNQAAAQTQQTVSFIIIETMIAHTRF